MWQRIKDFFVSSEIIALARLQMLLGALATIVTMIDPVLVQAAFPGARWIPLFVLGHGFFMEYLRRRRTVEINSHLVKTEG